MPFLLRLRDLCISESTSLRRPYIDQGIHDLHQLALSLLMFCFLPALAVCCSWLRGLPDEFTGMLKYGVAMPGAQLGGKLPYFFDEVFRLGIGKTPDGQSFRFLQTQPDNQHDSKDRSGALDAMEYPHLRRPL
jgi:hypothetical protein